MMVSAIILAYNRCTEVLKTISKLKQTRQSFPYEMEIIVVDNASADGTSIQIAAVHPDVILVTKPVNNGIAGWNEGFKVAGGKYLLVLDDDSHMDCGLAEAVDYLEENPDTGILAFQIRDEHTPVDQIPLPRDAWRHLQDIVGFIGCGAIIRQEVYQKIGGFAEWIYVYTHEFEFSIRCLDAGWRIVFFAKGIVVHRTSPINRTYKRIRTFATRNEMAIVHKYFIDSRPKFILRILLNNLKFIKSEGLGSGWYILQGFFKFLQLRKRLGHTPVSRQIQNFYALNFWSTKPVITRAKR
jgi:GT2 family glycosyltransferase